MFSLCNLATLRSNKINRMLDSLAWNAQHSLKLILVDNTQQTKIVTSNDFLFVATWKKKSSLTYANDSLP